MLSAARYKAAKAASFLPGRLLLFLDNHAHFPRDNASFSFWTNASYHKYVRQDLLQDNTFTDDFGQTLYNVHAGDTCVGPACPIHNPTDHSMRHLKLYYRFDRGIFERICPHGIGHPDPDSIASNPSDDGIHGCDGCCRPYGLLDHPDAIGGP